MSLDNQNLEESSESGSNGESKDAEKNAGSAGLLMPGMISPRERDMIAEAKLLIETLNVIKRLYTNMKVENIYFLRVIGRIRAKIAKKRGYAPFTKPSHSSETAIPEEPVPESVYPEPSKLITVDDTKKSMENGHDPEHQLVEEAESSHVNMDMDMVVADNGDKGDI